MLHPSLRLIPFLLFTIPLASASNTRRRITSCFTNPLLKSARSQSNPDDAGIERGRTKSNLFAAPKRLEDNVDGVLYVNDRCINCQACNSFAPSVFEHSSRHGKYVVKKQPDPDDEVELDEARAALSACPVAAIRVENSAKSKHVNQPALADEDEALAKKLAINPKLNGLGHPFPRPLTDGVWYVGHHNDASFGATPYVVEGRSASGETITVMVDTPKFGPSAVRTVQSLCGEDGPTFLFLTHVDDTAHHLKWKEHFPKLRRIFHEGDLGEHNWLNDHTLEDVEIVLRGSSSGLEAHDASSIKAWTLDGTDVDLGADGVKEDFLIIHTPGHSPGSISMLRKNSGSNEGQDGATAWTLFTGDTLAYSPREKSLSGFPRYGNNLKLQAHTLQTLLDLPRLGYDWTLIAPGHGQYRDYVKKGDLDKRDGEVKVAAEKLFQYR